ncbi:MAG: hypothetical protein M3014_03330 [Chloroflexota bacterium]|nr:hypothetical protein [Chloroflexota bacterium]
MKNRKFQALLLPMLCVIGVVAILAGCGGSSSDTGTTTDAQKQFLADRGSGTPGAAGTPGVATGSGSQAGQNGQGGAGFAGVFGTVDRVEGDKVYIKDQSGQSTTVQMASAGKIFKQATAQISDIKVGDAIVATGPKNGTSIDATNVQVADASMLADLSAGGFGRGFGGGGRFQGTPGAARTPRAGRTPYPGRTPRAGGTPGAGGRGFGGTLVIGTVEKIDGNTISIKPQTAGDPTTVNLTTTTGIRRQAAIALSDLRAGNTVVASGTQNGDIFQATRLQVTQAP